MFYCNTPNWASCARGWNFGQIGRFWAVNCRKIRHFDNFIASIIVRNDYIIIPNCLLYNRRWAFTCCSCCSARAVFWWTCLSVCVSLCLLCLRAYLWNYRSKLHQLFFACYLRPWLGSYLAALRYFSVLPVLWMTSCFHIMDAAVTWQQQRFARANAPAAWYWLRVCPKWRRVPRPDETFVRDLSGAESAMHHRERKCAENYNKWHIEFF